MSNLNTCGRGDGSRRGGCRENQSQEGSVGRLTQHVAHHRYSQDGEVQSSRNNVESISGGSIQFHRRMSARKKKPIQMDDFVTLDETGEFPVRLSPNQAKKRRRRQINFNDSNSSKIGDKSDINEDIEESVDDSTTYASNGVGTSIASSRPVELDEDHLDVDVNEDSAPVQLIMVQVPEQP